MTRAWQKAIDTNVPYDINAPPGLMTIISPNYLQLGGGAKGEVLTTDGNSNLSWQTPSVYLGTWAPATNTPDLTKVVALDGSYYIAETAIPTVPEVPPVNIPGIGMRQIYNGDMIIWSGSLAAWTVVHSSALTITTADARYCIVIIADSPPSATKPGDMWFDSINCELYIWYDDGTSKQWVLCNNSTALGSSGKITYSMLPPEVQQIPVAFPIVGQPQANVAANVPMGMPVTVAAGLVGTVVYAGIAATDDTVFSINKVSGGIATSLGTITVKAGSQTAATLAGPGGSLAIGDVLQLVSPGVQDPTLANLGISVMAMRV